MALIFRVGSEQEAPKWLGEMAAASGARPAISEAEAARMAKMSGAIGDEQLSAELDLIEQAAKAGGVYRYSASLGDAAQSQIREYAEACGCKIERVDLSASEIVTEASDEPESLVKTASAPAPEALVIESEFTLNKIDDKVDPSANRSRLADAVSYWEEGRTSAKAGKPAIQMPGMTVSRAVSAGDDDFAGVSMRSSAGRNSIVDPDAIGRASKAAAEDTGERLRKERSERADRRKAEIRGQEAKIAKSMEDSGFGAAPTGNFRISEMPSVQGGVANRLGKAPTTSPGAALVDARKAREASAAAKQAARKSQWDATSSSKSFSVSDDFANALKSELGKIK